MPRGKAVAQVPLRSSLPCANRIRSLATFHFRLHNEIGPPVVEHAARKKQDAADEVLPGQKGIQGDLQGRVPDFPEVGNRGHREQHRTHHEGHGGQVHKLQGDTIVRLDDLEHIDTGPQNEKQAADDEGPGAGREPAHRRKEEDATGRKHDRTPDIARSGNVLNDHRAIVNGAIPPMLADFRKIVHGDHQVEQGTAEEGPGPDVRVGFETGEKQDAADNENDAADFVENGVDGFPAKLGPQIGAVPGEIVDPVAVGKHVRHMSSPLLLFFRVSKLGSRKPELGALEGVSKRGVAYLRFGRLKGCR